MTSRKAILLIFSIILVVFFTLFFIWLVNQKEAEPLVLENAELTPIEDNTEDKLKEVVNKTIRDLDLKLTQECRGDNGSFLCEGSVDGSSFQLLFVKKDYGSWVSSWNILLNKTNNQEGEAVSKSKILGLDAYSQVLIENIGGDSKRVWETTSTFNNVYSFSASIEVKPGKISSKQIIEKLISNLKKYE
jgi:hypothetical protein